MRNCYAKDGVLRIAKWLVLQGIGTLSANHFANEIVRICGREVTDSEWPDENFLSPAVRGLVVFSDGFVRLSHSGLDLMEGRSA